MNLKLITKNRADQEKRSFQNIHFKAIWPHNGKADSVGDMLISNLFE